MAVLIAMRIHPVDWERFCAALRWLHEQRPATWLAQTVYRAEDDPRTVLVIG